MDIVGQSTAGIVCHHYVASPGRQPPEGAKDSAHSALHPSFRALLDPTAIVTIQHPVPPTTRPV